MWVSNTRCDSSIKSDQIFQGNGTWAVCPSMLNAHGKLVCFAARPTCENIDYGKQSNCLVTVVLFSNGTSSLFKVFFVSSNITPSFIQITVSGPLSKPRPKCALWHNTSNDIGKRGVEVQASANNISSVLVMQRLYSMTKKNNAITLCLIIIFKYLNCLLCCCLAKVRWHQQENGSASW